MLAHVGALGRYLRSSCRSWHPFSRQVATRWRQDGPCWRQDGVKMAHVGAKLLQDGAKMLQNGHCWGQDA